MADVSLEMIHASMVRFLKEQAAARKDIEAARVLLLSLRADLLRLERRLVRVGDRVAQVNSPAPIEASMADSVVD